MRYSSDAFPSCQEQTVNPKQTVVKDSLKVESSLRTPILQPEQQTPAYLRKQAPQRVELVKAPKQELSSQDSTLFNINAKTSDQGNYFFDNSLSVFEAAYRERVVFKDEIIAVEQFDSLLVDSVQLSVEGDSFQLKKKESILKESVEVRLKNDVIKVRHTSPFDEHKEWMSGLIILTLIIAGFVRLSSNKYLYELFSAVRFQHSASKLHTTVNVQNQKPMFALSALFFISTALMVFEFALSFGQANLKFTGIALYGIILIGLLLYFLVKQMMYRGVAMVFGVGVQTGEYLFNAGLLSQVYGLVLLPIVSLVPFVDQGTGTFLLKIGVTLFLFMYVIQLIRGAKIILRSSLSIFYMFLYFCALEILPLSILLKVLMF
ncbi:MAG: DUF4271 domain-containing protein [Marinilabiliaceae bacterium]|nr:DUF4271 domain-containing protein [Marinilabiliaceae bacterium]